MILPRQPGDNVEGAYDTDPAVEADIAKDAREEPVQLTVLGLQVGPMPGNRTRTSQSRLAADRGPI
jgi:hypothetical protein